VGRFSEHIKGKRNCTFKEIPQTAASMLHDDLE
jgi:hypothetical protein